RHQTCLRVASFLRAEDTFSTVALGATRIARRARRVGRLTVAPKGPESSRPSIWGARTGGRAEGIERGPERLLRRRTERPPSATPPREARAAAEVGRESAPGEAGRTFRPSAGGRERPCSSWRRHSTRARPLPR